MNEQREDGMIWMAVVLWAMVIGLIVMLSSCTAKKVVTEYIAVHDTLIQAHTDTVSVERWQWRHDTVCIESERVVTLLQADKATPAETIRIETHDWHWQHVMERDSSSKVVARVDSILRALDRQRERETVKTKAAAPMWEYGVLLLIVGGACVLVLKSRMF